MLNSKKYYNIPAIITLLSSTSFAAIGWTSSSTAWNSLGSSYTLVADPDYQADDTSIDGPFGGIEAVFTAVHTDVSASTTANAVGQYRILGGINNFFEFRNTAALGAGDVLKFNFDFNSIIGSGDKTNVAAGNNARATTSASFLKIGSTTATNTDLLDVTFTGVSGTNTIDSLIPLAPVSPGLTLPLTTIAGDTDPLTAPTNLDFNNFIGGSGSLIGITGTDQLNFQSDGTNNIRTNITDIQRSSVDFSFANVEYTFTAGAGGVAANQRFRFTFEGINVGPDPIMVPEPSATLFGCVASIGLLARRRRSRS